MRPLPTLFLLFLVVPIAEMYVLIKVGGEIGAFNTVGLVVLTAIIGVALMRSQGLSTFNNIQSAMNQGKIPAMELAEGAAILLAGAFLLTPGFITDTFGFLCLTPPVRRGLIRYLIAQRLHVYSMRGAKFHSSRTERSSGNSESESLWGQEEHPQNPRMRSNRGRAEKGHLFEGEFRHDD